MSVGFYPARDYQPLMEFGAIRMGGSKSVILTVEQVYTLAECLPKTHDYTGRFTTLGHNCRR